MDLLCSRVRRGGGKGGPVLAKMPIAAAKPERGRNFVRIFLEYMAPGERSRGWRTEGKGRRRVRPVATELLDVIFSQHFTHGA